MGAHTTITVSRDKAIAYLMERLLHATNSDLEALLDRALDERLYRARVVWEAGEDDHLLTRSPQAYTG